MLRAVNPQSARPTSEVELAGLGLIEPLSSAELALIARGGGIFDELPCSDCHKPKFASGGVSYIDDALGGGIRPQVRRIVTMCS